jgi:hypothetical protein
MEIRDNLAALVEKSKPKDLVEDPKSIERAIRRIPRVADAWIGTLPAISKKETSN